MIFLAKLMTLLTISWITMYTYFCISLLLHHYPLLIESLISQNLLIFTPCTIGIGHVPIALVRLIRESLSRHKMEVYVTKFSTPWQS